MADRKASTQTPSTVTDASRFVGSEAGVDTVYTGLGIRDYIGDALGIQAIAAQTVNGATTAYLTRSGIAVPPAGLRQGTAFRWEIELSKTAFGTAARTFRILVGTLGTTADAAILSFVQTSLPTAVADVGRISIIATMRAIGAAAGVMKGSLELRHNGNTVGLASVPTHIINPAQSAAFNTTTAGLIVGLSVTTGTAEVLTFEQVMAEAKAL